MLRFLSDRRAWVVALLFVAIGVALLWTLGTRQAPGRIEEAVRQRLGLATEIGDAEVGLSGVDLMEVVLRDDTGGLSVRIEHLHVDLAAWQALISGSRGVRGLDAKGVAVSIDLGRDGVDESLTRLLGTVRSRSSSESGAAKSTSGGRTYVVQDLVLDVSDSHGPLVRVSDADIEKRGDVVEASVANSLVGVAEGDYARVGHTTATLQRQEGAWVLASFSVDGGRVRWLGASVDEQTPLALRLRTALGALRRSAPKTDEAGEPADQVARARGRVFLDRLSSETKVVANGIDIESRTAGSRVERIEGLNFSITGEGGGWFRLRTAGQMSNDGEVDINVRLQPTEARAEGRVLVRGVSLALIAPFVPEVPLYNPEAGVVTAELELDADATGEIHLEGVAALRDGALFSERLAPEPIEGLSGALKGKGVWFPAERRLVIDQGQLRLGDARVLIDGELERNTEYARVDLTARMPPTPCNDVVGAIPKDVFGPLAGFEWSGTWGGIGHIAIDSRDLEATVLTIQVRDLCEFVRAPRWVRVERFQEPFRHSVVEPDDTVFKMVTGPTTDNWVPFEEVSPFMVEAVLSHEDARFYDHGGFAPWAIRDALVRNLQERRYVVGASTISMQLAKNLYLKREKTIARKVQEVILTWWLENALNKDQMLELYLNVIEYGPGTYGLRNASMYYFGRPPSDLSPAEAAFLACILPSPKRFHLSYERDALTRSMRGKVSRLLEHMAKRGRIGPEALAYGLAEVEQFDFHHEEEPLPGGRILPPLGVDDGEPEDPDPFEALFVSP